MCTVRTGIHMYDVHTPGQSCVYDPSTSCFQLFVLQNISYRYLFSYPNGGYALPFTFLVSNLNVSHLEYNSPEVYLARTPDAPTARPVFLLAKPRGNYIPNDLHLNSTLEKWKVGRNIRSGTRINTGTVFFSKHTIWKYKVLGSYTQDSPGVCTCLYMYRYVLCTLMTVYRWTL